MDVVILAAGIGRRMGSHSRHIPKCLVSVGGQPILIHSIRKLISRGYNRIIIVTGYLSEKIEQAVKPHTSTADIVFARNSLYAQTGTATSLCCAKPFLTHRAKHFLLLEGDLLYDSAFLDEACRHQTLATIFTADLSGSGDEVYVITSLDAQPRQIAKIIGAEEQKRIENNELRISGELAGISVLPIAFIQYLAMKQGRLPGFSRRDYESFLCEFGSISPLSVCWLQGRPWTEVDTMQDLKRAREFVWPLLARTENAE